MVMQSLRMLCSSSTIKKRMRKSSVIKSTRPADHGLHQRNQLLDAKWLFQVGHAGLMQHGGGFFVGGVAGGEQQQRCQLRTVMHHSGMNVGSANAARRATVRISAH